ncbi:MAG: YkgJ family cysteine cluster protein [Candidatus Omnitrophota bacterium]
MIKCRKCESKCCRYFGLQIDPPKTKNDFENIRWFLAHKGVAVFVEKRKWYLEIGSKCQFLIKNHACKIYDKRPLICREHSPTTCENALGKYYHEHVFKNMAEFDKYLAKRFKKTTSKK